MRFIRRTDWRTSARPESQRAPGGSSLGSQQKTPRRGGGALLGLLQGGENCKVPLVKRDFAWEWEMLCGCVRLFPVYLVADWRATGAQPGPNRVSGAGGVADERLADGSRRPRSLTMRRPSLVVLPSGLKLGRGNDESETICAPA
jgi:hypothetical protein